MHNPVKFVIAHIGESHIISLEKAEACVIILKIQGVPHSRGHLINKAKNAFVPAGAVGVHQPLVEGQA